jgi:dTDP-4-amino-4,6-dideoxy-D-galactose acyltransferase
MSAAAPKNVARFLEWDTQFFGVRIATIECAAIGDPEWRTQLAWCQAERIECLYVLMDAQDKASAANTGLADASWIDQRFTYERETAPLPQGKPSKATLRHARTEDTPVLEALAMVAHNDTRFWKDGRFPEERCAQLYATWIRRSLEGWAEAVFVAELQSTPVGYITCHAREGGSAEIGLIAVAESWRGEGIGRALVERALAWASEQALPHTRVVTQGTNRGAMMLYRSAGFRLVRSQCWYHLWFKQP